MVYDIFKAHHFHPIRSNIYRTSMLLSKRPFEFVHLPLKLHGGQVRTLQLKAYLSPGILL